MIRAPRSTRTVRGLQLLLVMLVCAGFVTPLTSSPSAAAPIDATPEPTQEVGACLAGPSPTDLLILMDQSASVGVSDGNRLRVSATAYLLRQLAGYSEFNKQDVQVAMAGFDSTYRRFSEWQNLEPSTVEALTSQLSALSDHAGGIDSDYASGLEGALQELEARQQHSSRCQILLWFTDGQFDIDPRKTPSQREQFGTTKFYAPGITLDDTSATEKALGLGLGALCRNGGIVDQLGFAGISTIAVGLGQPEASPRLDFLRSISSDSTAERPCGSTASRRANLLLPAADLNHLLFQLGSIDPNGAPITAAGPVCLDSHMCPSERFELDNSVQMVRVLAGADRAGFEVQLSKDGFSPTIKIPSYQPGNFSTKQQVAGQEVEAQWLSDRLVELTIRKQQATSWPGSWSVGLSSTGQLVRQPQGRLQVHIVDDLVPALASPPSPLRSGTDQDLQLKIISRTTGEDVPLRYVPGSAEISASLRTRDGRSIKLPTATDSSSSQLDLRNVAPGPATVRLTLALVTASSSGGLRGTHLSNRVADYPIEILPAASHPPKGASTQWWILAVGLLVPVFLLYLLKWSISRLPAVDLMLGSLVLKVNDDVVTRVGGLELKLSVADLKRVKAGPTRRAVALGIAARLKQSHDLVLRSRMGLMPWLIGHAELVPRATATFVGSSERRGRHRLPLVPEASWVAFAQPGSASLSVYIVTDVDATDEVCDRLGKEICDRLPQLVMRGGAATAESPDRVDWSG